MRIETIQNSMQQYIQQMIKSLGDYYGLEMQQVRAYLYMLGFG